MKILVVGAAGTVGQGVVTELARDHDIISAGRTSGDLQVDLTRDESVEALFRAVGAVDAVIAATGNVHFGDLRAMTPAQFTLGLNDKLMGQVRLVLIGQHYVNAGGSFTLTSGILAQQPIAQGVSAMAVNRALEGFVEAAANELPRQRINAVSPTVLTEALEHYGPYFPGFESAAASRVALAYRRSVQGIQSGQVYRVW
ncbi:short chain dehydrogenase [Pantoea sp. 1.19]|uniref:short chain dehydrogenase n=1 Tax=Pantoea sp. 1.19 TaxID=1925589 RepID=UPI000948E6AD|nr:short chain dehydrogenase [Pantoea sp. 1.19]